MSQKRRSLWAYLLFMVGVIALLVAGCQPASPDSESLSTGDNQPSSSSSALPDNTARPSTQSKDSSRSSSKPTDSAPSAISSPTPSAAPSSQPGSTQSTSAPDDKKAMATKSAEASDASGKQSQQPAAPQASYVPPPAAAPNRLIIPVANIDVAVHAMSCGENVDPPLQDASYWCQNDGKPGTGSNDTVYILGHSLAGGGWQLNRLSTQVDVGDTLKLQTTRGTVKYVVDNRFTHEKPTLHKSDIWNSRPGHLYLISSYTGDIWNKNIVISARPVG